MTSYYYSNITDNTGSTVALLFVVPDVHWYNVEWVTNASPAEYSEIITIADTVGDIINIFRDQTDAGSLASIIYNWLYHYKAGSNLNLVTYSASTEDITKSIKDITKHYTKDIANAVY